MGSLDPPGPSLGPVEGIFWVNTKSRFSTFATINTISEHIGARLRYGGPYCVFLGCFIVFSLCFIPPGSPLVPVEGVSVGQHKMAFQHYRDFKHDF